MFDRAGLSLRAGNALDAGKDLKEVLHYKPDFAEGHVVMAAVYKAQNMRGNERQELNEALRINPSMLQARLTLARSFTQANEAKAALDLLNNTPPRQKGALAVVTERTHEIGIRKSVGARRVDILSQFLVESAMLSGMGGVIGVILAWFVAILVKVLTPVPMHIPISAVVVGVTLSATVGLFFGIYPARTAAGLDPIEALRVER